jgi:hypothetical protein
VVRYSAEARLALVFAPGPALKAVATILSQHLSGMRSGPRRAVPNTNDGGTGSSVATLESMQAAVDAAQAGLGVPVVLLYTPALPPLP